MNDALQFARDHAFDVVAIAAVLAAVLPPAADPQSVWGRVRQVLDVVGFNVGHAQNASARLRLAVQRQTQLLELFGQVRDEQGPTGPAPPAESPPPTAGPG